jgi:hypothetical protein
LILSLLRKERQVADDPVLARWLIGRVLNPYPGEPAYRPHRSPYLEGMLPLAAERPRIGFAVRRPR